MNLRFCFSLLAFLFLCSGIASAQPKASGPNATDESEAAPTFGVLEGSIVGSDTGDLLPTATVSVWSLPDSVLVTGSISDIDGRFMVDRLDAGSYYVQVTFVGYTPFQSSTLTISSESPRIDLREISLSPDAVMLTGVEVVAERADVSFEIDRTVYNTKDQIASSGGNATDVLQNIPSIEVDIDGNISLRGNQNVGILIDGKPAPARGDFITTFLRQISAEMIERVEVIPNPSAKFDPEGMAGMINIVLKKGTDLGTSGGVTVAAGTADEYNASGNLNVQKGPLAVFSSLGLRTEDRGSSGYNFRENRYLDPLTFFEQDSGGTRGRQSLVGSISADYALSEMSTFSGSALVSSRSGDSNDLNRVMELATGQIPSERYDRSSISEGSGTNMDFSTSFRRVVAPSSNELSAELRFNRSTNNDLDVFEERQLALSAEDVVGLRERSSDALDVAEDEWTGQVDWTRPIGAFKLETGYKGTLRGMQNELLSEQLEQESGLFRPDVSRTNAFDYSEQVQAGYALLSGGTSAFDFQAGVRVERATTSFDLNSTGEVYDNEYGSLFPSAAIAWKPTVTRQVKLSYSKRVNRPRTRMLNPFATQTDPLNLFVGNPYLLPEYTHAFELGLQQFTRSGSLSITPYFRRTVNQMQRYKTVNSDGSSTLTYRNFDQSDSYGAEVVGSMRIGSALSGFASFNAYRVVTDASNVDAGLASDAFSWSARANLTWNVRPGLDVQAFYFYRAPTDVAQGRISSFSVANFSVRQKLMDDRASISLRVSDPLDRMGFRFELDNPDFYQLGTRKWESRRASLTFTYNFGQAPKRKSRQPQDSGDSGMGDMGIN